MANRDSFLAKLVYLQFGFASLFIALMGLAGFGLLMQELTFPHWLRIEGLFRPGPLWKDAFLVALFGLQHSFMARKWAKHIWVRYLTPKLERNFYVMLSGFALMLLSLLWSRDYTVVWDLRDTSAGWVLGAGAVSGWALIALSALSLDGLGLIGLRQFFANLMEKEEVEVPFRIPLLYRFVRHPLYLGFLLSFWLGPLMELDRLVMALAMSAWLLLAIQWEEKDLVARFGKLYEDYQKNVPMLIPFRLQKRSK